MAYFTKLLFIALSGIDPLIFVAPICLGLGVSFVAVLMELEQVRARRRKARRLSPKSQAVFRQQPPDRQN
jgi:hypothetical protein